MEVALAQEKIWFDKYKYEEAEKVYFENLAKLLISSGSVMKQFDSPKINIPFPSAIISIKDDPTILIPDPITYNTSSEPIIEDKRFKVKNRNRSKKDSEQKVDKHLRQEIKVDGIAKLTTDNIAAEIYNRLNSLESENVKLNKGVKDLQETVSKLTERIIAMENSSNAAVAVKPAVAATKKPPTEEEDDGVDLFGSDSEEEDEEAKKVKEQRLAEYAARKSKKPVLIAKSNIILDVKPWDDETDMKKMETEVRKVTTDGLIWGASKLVPLAYGIHKLQISCVVEDDKVSVDWLQEQLEAIEDFVQSVDIAAFNKV